MHNILFIGCYKQIDMWGEASYRFLKCLNSIENINLAARSISFNGLHREKEEWVENFERQTFSSYHKIIQYCPPQYYVGGPNCIGACIIEPYYLAEKDWIRQLKNMPELIVSSDYELSTLHSSGIYGQIHVIESSTLPISFCNKQPPIRNLERGYNFYWIGDYNTRTDYQTIIRAFHSEFDNSDDCSLSMYFICEPTQENANKIKEEINTIKLSLNKYINPNFYKEDFITIGKNLNEISPYHEYCNCMIDISRGGINPHIGDAIKYNNKVILNKWSGLSQYDQYPNRPLICDFSIVPIVSAPYSCKSLWCRVDQKSLQSQMRQAYLSTKNQKYNMEQFSTKNISNKIRAIF